jgi:hypothetical protein
MAGITALNTFRPRQPAITINSSDAAASCSMWSILREGAARLGFHFPRDKTLSQSWPVVIQGTDFRNHHFHYSK